MLPLSVVVGVVVLYEYNTQKTEADKVRVGTGILEKWKTLTTCQYQTLIIIGLGCNNFAIVDQNLPLNEIEIVNKNYSWLFSYSSDFNYRVLS